jgi:hypothetical protein
LLAAVVTTIDYLAWLGWHRAPNFDAAGHLYGPYRGWQVTGLVVVLALLTIVSVATTRVPAWRLCVTISGVMTIRYSLDSSGDPQEFNDGLWPFGAALVALAAAAATTAVSYGTHWVCRWARTRHKRRR